MINILNLPAPSLLHPATYLQQGSSISLLSNCFKSSEWCMAHCQLCVPMHIIYIRSNYESMSLQCIKLPWVTALEIRRRPDYLLFNWRISHNIMLLSSFPDSFNHSFSWEYMLIALLEKCLSTYPHHVYDVLQLAALAGMWDSHRTGFLLACTLIV